MRLVFLLFSFFLTTSLFSQGAGVRYLAAAPAYTPDYTAGTAVMAFDTTTGKVYYWDVSAWSPVDDKEYGNEASSTDGSGDIVVTFPTAFAAAPSTIVVTGRGTTAYIYNVTARDATSFTVRVFNDAGAAVLSTAMDFDWIAIR